ncbi:hypothetical protein B0H63DRAFT_486938 [Podospora didyma]|uniref:F-box domain-containing protein n=1 Tax=Podospora didyma TaxID=330526 RepID=A0AAE0K5F0_9PEZI|nr:hypothetical protein B0H63DRAFT_486938 [Podospora didyma]
MASSSDAPIVWIDSLPPELLSDIFGYLAPEPSVTRFHGQPGADMFTSLGEQTLKNVSLVNKRWRATSMPLLFCHALWHLDRWEPIVTDKVERIPFLRFIRDNDLGRHVDTLTLVFPNATLQRDEGRLRLPEDSGSSLTRNGQPSPRRVHTRSSNCENWVGPRQYSERHLTFTDDNNRVWALLFTLMDPRTFTIVAAPQILAKMFSRGLYLGDAWSFNRGELHLISLSCETRSPPPPISQLELLDVWDPIPRGPFCQCNRSRPRPCDLFTIRPWTSALLNEGSFTRVYKTYEFFLRRPPSILEALLGYGDRPNAEPLIPDTVKSFSYVAVFPLSTHFNHLVTYLPHVEHLFIQLVPRDDIFSSANTEEMRNVQASDLWMERNSCYSLVMRELLSSAVMDQDDDDDDDDDDDIQIAVEQQTFEPFSHNPASVTPPPRKANWRLLKEFESGDAADREAWEMAVHYVNSSGSAWTVEREGVFVKMKGTPNGSGKSSGDNNDYDMVDGGDAQREPGQAGEETEETAAVQIFQGQLERLAFSGVAKLPYGPMMYAMDDSEAVYASMSSWQAAMQLEDDFELETYMQGVDAPTLWWQNPDGS